MSKSTRADEDHRDTQGDVSRCEVHARLHDSSSASGRRDSGRPVHRRARESGHAGAVREVSDGGGIRRRRSDRAGGDGPAYGVLPQQDQGGHRVGTGRSLPDFGGAFPDTIEELTGLSGVGRKTANLIVGVAYGKPAVIVDTHVKRVTGRLGLTEDDDPTKIEFDLREILIRKRNRRTSTT